MKQLWIILALMAVLAASSCTREPADRPSQPRAGLAGPIGLLGAVGPMARACDGVTIEPSDAVQPIIDAHPAGTTYCFSSGTYRLRSALRPKAGDSLIGRLGAVVSGSQVLTGWRKTGRGWSTTGFLPASPGEHGSCRPTEPTCTYAEDVFVDKERLTRVSSLSKVVNGTVYADYGTNTITIGDDPTRHLVEQAVAPSLIRTTADNITVANFVLEQAANEAQTAAVESRQVTPPANGSGWRILHNEVRLNHGVGLGIADGAFVSANFVHHQGQLGFGAWGTRTVVSGNEISFNGQAGYAQEWESGGSKSWQTDRQTITHNYIHDNLGPGLWSDGGAIRTAYSANRITGNWGAGIQHELSYDATIRDNEITGNGKDHKGWAWEGGIQIQSSGGIGLIEITGNTVARNANGIVLIDSGNRAYESPAPHGPHLVRNVWVHDNRITMEPGQTSGAVQDTGDTAIYTKWNNRFEANTYYLTDLDGLHFSWNDTDLDWADWRALGHDPDGRAERTSR